MKILFINTVDLNKNGISTFIINNAKLLANHNSISIAYFNTIEHTLEKSLIKANIKLIHLPSRKGKVFLYYRKLIDIIRNGKYDIVHVNGNSATMAIELKAAQVAGCKVRIAHSHNTRTEHKIINKLLLPLFNATVTNCLACSKEAGQWLFKNRKFYIVNNGVDLFRYYPNLDRRSSIRNKLQIKSNEIVLINVGGFNFQKNQEFLIRMIPLLKEKFKLILVGNGTNFKKDKQLVSEIGLERKVIFTGNIDNIQDYLSAADIFVMPSRFEGFPFSLVEAQASGLTCFVSDKITKQVNLTGNVNFLPIENVKPWIHKISQYKSNILFNKRLDKINEIQNKISVGGYDIRENANYLEKLFSNFLSKN